MAASKHDITHDVHVSMKTRKIAIIVLASAAPKEQADKATTEDVVKIILEVEHPTVLVLIVGVVVKVQVIAVEVGDGGAQP